MNKNELLVGYSTYRSQRVRRLCGCRWWRRPGQLLMPRMGLLPPSTLLHGRAWYPADSCLLSASSRASCGAQGWVLRRPWKLWVCAPASQRSATQQHRLPGRMQLLVDESREAATLPPCASAPLLTAGFQQGPVCECHGHHLSDRFACSRLLLGAHKNSSK